MSLSTEFWIQIIIYLISFVFSAGVVWTKLHYIEEKLDKHNKMIERLYIVEESTKSAHRRMDEFKGDEK